jgi:hypothetical protein
LSRYVFSRKNNDSELPQGISPELAKMKIRICTLGYPETGAVYFEGTVRTFIVERLPHPTLIDLLPNLLSVPRLTYRPGQETLLIEHITD